MYIKIYINTQKLLKHLRFISFYQIVKCQLYQNHCDFYYHLILEEMNLNSFKVAQGKLSLLRSFPNCHLDCCKSTLEKLVIWLNRILIVKLYNLIQDLYLIVTNRRQSELATELEQVHDVFLSRDTEKRYDMKLNYVYNTSTT